MDLLTRHKAVSLFVGLLLASLVALFVVYDSRSPVFGFLKAHGTVSIDRWSAAELDTLCIRLEPARGTPVVWADGAMSTASAALPESHVREVILVSFRDVCGAAETRLAWAVVVEWTMDAEAGSSTPARRPRGIAIVDAVTGALITSHADR
jgi:hypothetical protein